MGRQQRQQRQQSGGKVSVRGRQSRRSEAAVAQQWVGQAVRAVRAARRLASQLSSSGVARQEEGRRRREVTKEAGELGLKDKSLSG